MRDTYTSEVLSIVGLMFIGSTSFRLGRLSREREIRKLKDEIEDLKTGKQRDTDRENLLDEIMKLFGR